MQAILNTLRRILSSVQSRSSHAWRTFRGLRGRYQIGIAIIALALIGGLIFILGSGKAPASADSSIRAVTLKSVGELSGTSASESVLGTVRSVTEANILAESGGTVKRVNASIGTNVPAGFIIASLENASEAAAVLSAEGSYDAALAARDATSLSNTTASAEDTYRSAFSSLDTTLETQVDLFFGSPTPTGPRTLISTNDAGESLSRDRAALTTMMNRWQANLASAGSRDPLQLLVEANTNVRQVATFLTKLADATNKSSSNASAAQIAALAAARAEVDGILATLTAAEARYRSGSIGATAGADASVKQALGALRLAQASFEKTVIRAPIAGTVNFLPIRVGDYVTAFTHVATVAQNGALEIIAYVSEDERESLSAGGTVSVAGKYDGIITAIAPALDPITKQIEIRVAVNGATDLVNGQSVRIAFASTAPEVEQTTQGPVLLPLAAVKLAANSRMVFTVDKEGLLTAVPVTIGDVEGDRIVITSTLSPDLRIVTDARGLANGQRVKIAQ